VGSRKELKKNAVPTLFCNCASQQSTIEADEKCINKSEIVDEPNLRYRATILDHPYCLNWVILTERNKEIKTALARKRSWKHDSDCNLLREALKNTTKKIDNTFSKDSLAMTPNSLLIKPPEKKFISRTKRNKLTLKSQLQNALDENAKLKRQLSTLKNSVIPSNSLNCQKIRIVRLEKIV